MAFLRNVLNNCFWQTKDDLLPEKHWLNNSVCCIMFRLWQMSKHSTRTCPYFQGYQGYSNLISLHHWNTLLPWKLQVSKEYKKARHWLHKNKLVYQLCHLGVRARNKVQHIQWLNVSATFMCMDIRQNQNSLRKPTEQISYALQSYKYRVNVCLRGNINKVANVNLSKQLLWRTHLWKG